LVTPAYGQEFTAHLYVFQDTSATDGIESGYADTLTYGCDSRATPCIDGGLETELPPRPPAGIFDARFTDEYADVPCMGQGTDANFLPVPALLQLTTEFGFVLQNGDGTSKSIRLTWDNPIGWGGYAAHVTNDAGIDVMMWPGDSVSFTRPQYLNKYLFIRYDPVFDVRPTGAPTHSNFALRPAYPNPFNPATTVTFDVPRSSHVTIAVYNLAGERVALLVDGEETPGVKSATFDAAGLASGVYLCRMTAWSFAQTRKIILLK
jgi:hypothetical protein